MGEWVGRCGCVRVSVGVGVGEGEGVGVGVGVGVRIDARMYARVCVNVYVCVCWQRSVLGKEAEEVIRNLSTQTHR